jgi:hypothetical protein
MACNDNRPVSLRNRISKIIASDSYLIWYLHDNMSSRPSQRRLEKNEAHCGLANTHRTNSKACRRYVLYDKWLAILGLAVMIRLKKHRRYSEVP